MPRQHLGAYQEQLRGWAEALVRPAPRTPISVERICGDLGIKTQRSTSVAPFKSYLSFNSSEGDVATILLPEVARAENYNFERFCIAHELAHYVLLVHHNLTPRTNS